MLEYWQNFVSIFLFFILIGIIIYLLSNKKSREENMKKETYTCGEKIEQTYVPAENFYEAIKKNLRVDEISKLHSGKLSDYLLWFLIGLSAILVTAVFLL
ncbi:MAG: hypothetical protein QW051_01705 [Candidatus Aenigmatarchaeota archaeon]